MHGLRSSAVLALCVPSGKNILLCDFNAFVYFFAGLFIYERRAQDINSKRGIMALKIRGKVSPESPQDSRKKSPAHS